MDDPPKRTSSARLPAVRPRQRTIRGATGLIETEVSGRVDAPTIQSMANDFVRLGRSSVWLIDASGTTSYAPEAIAEAVKRFGDEGERGLRRIVAIVRAPLVRMGAQVVAASLALAKSPVEIKVVQSRIEASAWFVV